jgi:two-component SAPR family response regulator
VLPKKVTTVYILKKLLGLFNIEEHIIFNLCSYMMAHKRVDAGAEEVRQTIYISYRRMALILFW